MIGNRPFAAAQGRRLTTDGCSEDCGSRIEDRLSSPCDPRSAIFDPRSSAVGGRWSVVVVGYGNELRGDDAVGPRVAQAVAAWDLPGVCGLAIHQLTPELAEILAAAARAIFV